MALRLPIKLFAAFAQHDIIVMLCTAVLWGGPMQWLGTHL
jgi:hypothetical protein